MDKLSPSRALGPRDCVDLLFAREICCLIVSKAGRMVAGDIKFFFFFFFLLLDMRDLDKLK